MEISAPAWRRLEIWLAAVVVAASFAYAGLTAHAMATTSLSTDEFGTIGTFSSRGPLRVVTDYRAPKNHIFFNLLNSILPARESLNPFRARALSILATLLTGALIAAYAAWRGQWFEGAALVAVWALAPETLSLSMEARGYGFLGLFAVFATIAVLEYTRVGGRRWLALLGGVCVLGVYTIPSFLFFAGPVLLLLWLVTRNRETFLTGAATGVLILLLYLPVLRQLVGAFGQYQTGDEAEFAHLSSLWKTVRLFVYPGSDFEMALLLGALLLAPVAAFRWLPVGRSGFVLIAAACAIYFGTLLALHSPPLRTAAFGFLPALTVGFLSFGAALRRLIPSPGPALLGVALTALLLVSLGRASFAFDFLPTENWSLAGRAIDAAFPATVQVEYKRFAKYLGHTLPHADQRAADFDAASFADGKLVVVDAPNKWVDAHRFRASADLSRVVRWTISGQIRDLVLTFRRPAENSSDGIPPKLADGDIRSGVALSERGPALHVTPPAGAKALVVLLNRPTSERTLSIQASLPGAFLAGNAVVLPLDSRISTPVEITLRSKESGLSMTEAWIAR